MNNKRRKKLKEALALIESASNLIGSVREEEEDSLDSMPDPFLDSDQCTKMEEAIEYLDDAELFLDDASSMIYDILKSLDNAKDHIESAI